MLTLILILGILLVISSSFSRPAPVVIVHEQRGGGFFLTVLLIGLGIWLFLPWSKPDDQESVPSPDREEFLPKEQVSQEEEEPLINQAPPSHSSQVAVPDTHINVAPPSSDGAIHADHGDAHEHHSHLQDIILVKRFADSDKAALLQRHFSQWGMVILEVTDDSGYPYWSCVYIENEAEGRAKIREWNRNRQDFEHMGLELRLTQVKISNF